MTFVTLPLLPLVLSPLLLPPLLPLLPLLELAGKLAAPLVLAIDEEEEKLLPLGRSAELMSDARGLLLARLFRTSSESLARCIPLPLVTGACCAGACGGAGVTVRLRLLLLLLMPVVV